VQQLNLRLLQKNPRSLASVAKVVNELFNFVGNMPAHLKDRWQNEWIKTGKTTTQLFRFSNRQCLANHDRNRKEIEETKSSSKIFLSSQKYSFQQKLWPSSDKFLTTEEKK